MWAGAEIPRVERLRDGSSPTRARSADPSLLDDFLAAQLRPRTRATYETDLTIFLGWLKRRGVHPLQVGRREFDRYRNWMSELVGADGKPSGHGAPRFAAATVAKRLSAVRSFYSNLVDRRLSRDRVLGALPCVSLDVGCFK